MPAYVSEESLPPRSLDELSMLDGEFPIEEPDDVEGAYDNADEELDDEEEELIAW